MKSHIVWIFFLILGIHPSLWAQITFSEIMFNPSTNEYHDEFVEVFNCFENDSITLEGWMLSDGQSIDIILSHTGNKKIAPLSFGVILDGSYFLNSTVYDAQIPENVSVFKIDNNSFGANGLSNSTGETLTLVAPGGDTISLYTYSIDNVEGFSDEKIVLAGDNSPDNWANCRTEGGTPGFQNSVSPFDIDAALRSDAIGIQEPIFAGDKAEITVDIVNAGIHPIADSATVVIYLDHHQINSLKQMKKLLVRIPFLFQSEKNNRVVFQWEDIPAGEHYIRAELEAEWDMNISNNSSIKNIVVLSRAHSVHINEIKFLTQDSEPEWIEFVNCDDDPVFLKSWSVSDLQDTMVIDTAIYIYPGQFKVLAADSLNQIYEIDDSLVIINANLPSLNNTGDEITLHQPAGNWVERIKYTASWLEGEDYRNVSLERINPLLNAAFSDNWGPCVLSQGASPGKKNSIFLTLNKTASHICVTPNPFSPDADGMDDVTVISGVIPEKSVRMRIRIFDINGRLIRTLSDNQYSGSEFRVVWNGRNNSGALMSIGIYIILIEALNDRSGVYMTQKSWVVLAKKL